MTDAETAQGQTAAEAAAAASRRTRGASFPSLELDEAITLVRKIDNYGKTHKVAAIASFLGHTTVNSGAFRSKVAALREFGLLSGRGDDLTVTPLAQEILHPGLDADTTRPLRDAFNQCKLFETVYGALPKSRELDVPLLANTAMNNHGVANQAKQHFADVFVASGVTAGLVEDLGGTKIRLVEFDTSEGSHDADVASIIETTAPGNLAAPPTRKLPDTGSLIVNHAWQISGGKIRFVIEGTQTLPASAYVVIARVIEAGDELAQMLAPTEVSDDAAADSE